MNHRTGEQPTKQLSTSPASAWKSTTIENSTHAPVSVVEPENGERTSPLGQLSPKNIRRTRPTFWALMQHIFAIFLLSFMLLVAVGFYIQIPVGQQLDEISFNEFSYQFLGLQNQTLQLLDLIPAIAGVLAVVGIIFVLLWKHRFVPALVGLGVALCANLSAQVLKNLVISKPNFGIQEAALNSAPSGHTTFAAAAAAALFIASPKKLRPAVALLGAVISFAAGFSTIINGWHRPADVITAIILTSIWTVIGLTILRFLRSEELDLSNTQRTGLILIPLLSISGFFLGFCSLALYLVTFYDPIPGGALMAAICMILAVLAFTTSLQIGLLRARNKQRSAYTKIWTY